MATDHTATGRAVIDTDDGPVLVVDSVSFLGAGDRGAVVVSGSHGGISAGEHAAGISPALIGFNDAGVGKDDAGIAGLALLETSGIAAFAVGHQTARIGDAADHWASGVLTATNAVAAAAGLIAGMRTPQAVAQWFASEPPGAS